MFVVETALGQEINDSANSATEYIYGLNGIVPDFLDEINLSWFNNTLTIGAGMIIADGRKIINYEPYEINIASEGSGSRQYLIVLKIDMANPNLVDVLIEQSPYIPPFSDNIFSDFQAGIKYVTLGTLLNGTGGIALATLSLKKVLKVDLPKIVDVLGKLTSNGEIKIEKGTLCANGTTGIIAVGTSLKWQVSQNDSTMAYNASTGVFTLKGGFKYKIRVDGIFSGGDFTYYAVYSGNSGVTATQQLLGKARGLGITYPTGANRFSAGGIVGVYDLTKESESLSFPIRVVPNSVAGQVSFRQDSSIMIEQEFSVGG